MLSLKEIINQDRLIMWAGPLVDGELKTIITWSKGTNTFAIWDKRCTDQLWDIRGEYFRGRDPSFEEAILLARELAASLGMENAHLEKYFALLFAAFHAVTTSRLILK